MKIKHPILIFIVFFLSLDISYAQILVKEVYGVVEITEQGSSKNAVPQMTLSEKAFITPSSGSKIVLTDKLGQNYSYSSNQRKQISQIIKEADSINISEATRVFIRNKKNSLSTIEYVVSGHSSRGLNLAPAIRKAIKEYYLRGNDGYTDGLCLSLIEHDDNQVYVKIMNETDVALYINILRVDKSNNNITLCLLFPYNEKNMIIRLGPGDEFKIPESLFSLEESFEYLVMGCVHKYDIRATQMSLITNDNMETEQTEVMLGKFSNHHIE